MLKKFPTVALLFFSALSLSACGPSNESRVSFDDVAYAAARQDDRVSVEQLAGWLIEGRGDFRLVDVRSPEDYGKGSIAGAENIPIAQLVSAKTIKSLPRDRMVLVYSNGSENAAKAVVMLRLSGLDAHLLTGGYNAWHARILNPDISADELDGESPRVTEQRAYSCYFVGERSGDSRPHRGERREPFVPPVFEETEEYDELEKPPPAEGC